MQRKNLRPFKWPTLRVGDILYIDDNNAARAKYSWIILSKEKDRFMWRHIPSGDTGYTPKEESEPDWYLYTPVIDKVKRLRAICGGTDEKIRTKRS